MTDIVKNATQNPVTGDRLVSKASNQKYRDNWDAIFKKKPEKGSIQEDSKNDL
tara:strand:- start:36110 stop:36268 length:159 start_codon:yes stop_codon:yes gene_type:complete